MKKQMMACCLMAAAMCGCNHVATSDGRKVGEGGPAFQRHECGHVRLKSVLGLSDGVLADTNRFPIGESPYGLHVKLDKPILGCDEATVYLDEMESALRKGSQAKPHQLRSVELKRMLPDQTTSRELVREAEKVIDEIAKLLDVETPPVTLAAIGSENTERERQMMSLRGGVMTSICFNLSDGQQITIRLIESGYVIRDGNTVPVRPAELGISITYGSQLFPYVQKHRRKAAHIVKVEKELDFGPDFSESLAKVLRNEMAEKRRETIHRRKRTEPQNRKEHTK